jgi:hypothetical protein
MQRDRRFEHVVTIRLSDKDYEKLLAACDAAELSKSEYLRYVIRLVTEETYATSRGGVLLDTESMRRCARELRRWGHHYNQAVHAMNAIALQSRKLNIDHRWLEAQIEIIERELAQVNAGRAELSDLLNALESRAVIGGK